MTNHSRRKSFLRNQKGYSGLIATIFMVLVALFLYFNVFMFILDRNTAFQDTSSQVTQIDVDRITEQLSVFGLSHSVDSPSHVSASFTVTNTSPLSIAIVSVWIKDLTNYGYNSTAPVPPIVLKPGERLYVPPGLVSVTINGASSSHLFASWFVTARGRVFNTVSAVAYVPGVLAGFAFNTIGNQKVGAAFTITITAVDAYGGIVQSYTGTNTMNDYTETMTPKTTGPFVNGVWTGQVVISRAITRDVILTQGGGSIGNSNPFDVVGGGAPFQLDGYNSTTSSPPSTSLSLTVNTTYADDLIYVIVAEHTVNVNGISTNLGLNLTNRINVTISSTDHMQTFYTVKSPSGPVIITINFTGNNGFCSAVAFGISGANTASPFDVSTPALNIGSNTHAMVTLNTNIPATSANDFIIGAVGVASSNPTLTIGAAFRPIANPSVSNIETAAEYEITPAPQTNLTVDYTLASSQTWAMVADAVKQG